MRRSPRRSVRVTAVQPLALLEAFNTLWYGETIESACWFRGDILAGPLDVALEFSLAHVTAAQIALASDSVEPTTRQLTLEGAGSKPIDVYGGNRMGVGIAHRNCPADVRAGAVQLKCRHEA